MNSQQNTKPPESLNQDFTTLNELITSLNKKPEIVFQASGSAALKTRSRDLFGHLKGRLVFFEGRYRQNTTQTYDLSALTQIAKIQHLSPDNLAKALQLAQINATEDLPPVDSAYHAVLPGKISVFCCPTAMMVLDLLTQAGERFHKIYGTKIIWLKQTPSHPLIKDFSEQSFKKESGAVFVHRMGLFVFGPDPQTVQSLLLDLSALAKKALDVPFITPCGEPEQDALDINVRERISELRKNISKTQEKPLLLRMFTNKTLLSIADNPNLSEALTAGPLTVEQERVFKNGFLNPETLHHSQPDNNALLIPELGLLVSGRSARDLAQNGLTACTILQNAVSAWGTGKLDSQTVKSTTFAPLNKQDIADFAGQVSLVTGAASTHGRALIASLLERGAAVIGLDENSRVELLFDSPAYLGLICNIADLAALRASLESAVRTFGGLDIAILNPLSMALELSPEEMDLTSWRSELQKSVDANLNLLQEILPLLKRSPINSRVIINLAPSETMPSEKTAYFAALEGMAKLAQSAATPFVAEGICFVVVSPYSNGSPSSSVINGIKIETNGCSINDIFENLVEIS